MSLQVPDACRYELKFVFRCGVAVHFNMISG